MATSFQLVGIDPQPFEPMCQGAVAEPELLRHFDNAQVAYLHLHNAMRGCFSCRVIRA